MTSRDALLDRLPAEIILRVLHFVSLSDIPRLMQTSRVWEHFINVQHQDIIYCSKTEHNVSVHDFSPLDQIESYAHYYKGVESCKDLCRRECLLRRNWASDAPITTESVIQTGDAGVWRFRPDFNSRFILSTSIEGGLRCTDMDTGELLWRLPEEEVLPYAHLEYCNGFAVWNGAHNDLEIWRTSLTERGHFHKYAVLHHDVETRGFHLAFSTQLCVVSIEGVGYYYDLSSNPPRLLKEMEIEVGAVGHLFQTSDMVMYSMGTNGFHIYSKMFGTFLGEIKPTHNVQVYHIEHTTDQLRGDWPPGHISNRGKHPYPPSSARQDRFTNLKVQLGSHPRLKNARHIEDDEWGAGVISNNVIVGKSKGGRIFICTDVSRSLKSPETANSLFHVIDTEDTPHNFMFGGWLAARDRRILFEVGSKIYCLTLPSGEISAADITQASVIAIDVASTYCSAIPVSWMGVYEDHLMYTYSTVVERGNVGQTNFRHGGALFPRKSIRVVSLAPNAAS